MSARHRKANGLTTSEPRQTLTVPNHTSDPPAKKLTVSQLAPALLDFYTVWKIPNLIWTGTYHLNNRPFLWFSGVAARSFKLCY